MGHTAETRQRAHDKVKARRAQWFAENGPWRHCRSWQNLELHHLSDKESHKVWSWSEERRNRELAKCIPLCRRCHKDETAKQARARWLRVPKYNIRKISDEDIEKAIALRNTGMTVRQIAPLFGVAHNTLAVVTARYQGPGKVRT